MGELKEQFREEGREEGKKLVALELLKTGMPVALVAKYTKLPTPEVEKMQKEDACHCPSQDEST